MKADAAPGHQTKISTNTDSHSQNSGKRKMSEFSCNPGMQKRELFFLLLLNSTLLYCISMGEVIVRLFTGTFSYRTCYSLHSYCRSVLLIIVKGIYPRYQ